MKKILLLLLLVLVACAPAAPPAREVAPHAAPPQVITQERVVSPPQPPTPVVREPEVMPEPAGYQIDPYSQLGCEQLLTAQEFAGVCGKQAGDLVVTYRIGTRNCIVNIKDRANERRTAGFTLTGHKDAESAEEEFDRRLVVLKVGADKSVGERAYISPAKFVDRETLEFLRDEFIVEAGTDINLCSKEGLLAVARVFDSHIK